MRVGPAILICAIASIAVAQRQPMLDLGAAPQPPPAGQGAGALALAAELKSQMDLLQQYGQQPRFAARRLARVLLTTGEEMGSKGSQRILIARTLVHRLPQLDQAIATASVGPAGETRVSLVGRDLDAAAAALENPSADPWRVVRDALASLTPPSDRPIFNALGWFDAEKLDDGPLTPDLDAWGKLTSITAQTIDTLRDLDARAELAQKWAAYRHSVSRLRSAVRGAMGTLADAPPWVPESSRRMMGEQINAAAKVLAADSGRDAGLAALERMSRLGALIAKVDKVDDTAPGKRIRSALAQVAGSLATEGEPARLAAFERTLDLALPQAIDEKSLVRQARPALRPLTTGLKAGEIKLLQALPDILTRDDAMSDPAITATIAAHRRAVQDVQALLTLNAAMVGEGTRTGEPVPQERWKRIADRVLKLGQDLAKPDTRDAALASLRGMAEQVGAFTKLPGEDALRAAGPSSAWMVLTGGRETALLSEISDRRGGWFDGWDKAGYAGSTGDVERLTALRALMEVLSDATGIVSAEENRVPMPYSGLSSWPGWDLSAEGYQVITGGLTELTGEAAKAITEGNAPECNKLVQRIRQDYAAALLAGRIGPGAKSSETVLLEVGSGGPVPGVSWMGHHADALADICRYAEEAAAARKLGARDRADAVLRFVNARAAAVIDQLSEPRP